MSFSFMNFVIVQLELWNEYKSGKQKVKVQGIRAVEALG
jgi:hypothetical protein